MESTENEALFKLFTAFETINIGMKNSNQGLPFVFLVASILSNLVLTYLIKFRSPKEIGAYQHLLLAFAVNDIYFPMIHYLTLPVCRCIWDSLQTCK